MVDLIPTGFRDPIANTLAYPVGSEAVSTALQGVEQYRSLSICFTAKLSYRANPKRILDLHDAGEFLPAVKSGWFRPEDAGYAASRSTETRRPSWSIDVLPVPRKAKRVVGDALIATGLGIIRDWLESFDPLAHERGLFGVLITVRAQDGETRAESIGRAV
jgi:hypothetical protein